MVGRRPTSGRPLRPLIVEAIEGRASPSLPRVRGLEEVTLEVYQGGTRVAVGRAVAVGFAGTGVGVGFGTPGVAVGVGWAGTGVGVGEPIGTVGVAVAVVTVAEAITVTGGPVCPRTCGGKTASSSGTMAITIQVNRFTVIPLSSTRLTGQQLGHQGRQERGDAGRQGST